MVWVLGLFCQPISLPPCLLVFNLTARRQTFVFAMPVPIRDRTMRLELYRTNNAQSRGRLVSMVDVSLHSMLPKDAAANPLATARVRVPLNSLHRGQEGGRLGLRVALVDTDMRRQARMCCAGPHN